MRCLLIIFLLLPNFIYAQSAASRLIQEATFNYRLGNYQTTITHSEQADNLIDRSNIILLTDNYVNWSSALIALGRFNEAITIGRRAQQFAPFELRIMQNLIEAYFQTNNHSEALPLIQQYIAINPTGNLVGRFYFYMGEIYLGQSLFNHADVAFSVAVHHTPNLALWWYRLGYAREMTRNFIGANHAYNEALRLNPSFTEVRRRQAAILPQIR
ncbi:MAG: tetratricopeptide repeat protein [Spirochaetaceae bacterium]|nr:tetratricopeptide repeat protein [Spirochaetaceae bacterium]